MPGNRPKKYIPMLHDYFEEKLLLVASTMFASGGTAVAAILSQGDVRWLLLTITVSMFTSVFLSLGFRRARETMKQVIARAGIAVLGGVFLTRYVAHHFKIEFAEDDAIKIAGTAAAVCGGSFLIGWPLIELINKRRDDIAKKLAERYKF